MALTLDELELETIELLPAREVMSGGGYSRKKSSCCGSDNDWNLLSGNVIQVGLVNFNHQDF